MHKFCIFYDFRSAKISKSAQNDNTTLKFSIIRNLKTGKSIPRQDFRMLAKNRQPPSPHKKAY